MTYDFNEETTLRNERYTQLNADQKYCFDTIVAGVRDHPRTAHFFVHGPAGTGKTFLYKTLCNHFRADNKIVLCVNRRPRLAASIRGVPPLVGESGLRRQAVNCVVSISGFVKIHPFYHLFCSFLQHFSTATYDR